jgi:large subunit ribosomal protein L23
MAIIETKKEDTKETKVIADKSKEKSRPHFAGKAEFASRFLLEPWITEKSHEKMAENKYVFRVSSEANKTSIKKSIEDLYKVTVTSVNIIHIPKKKRIYGRTKGFKSGFKKAIATLKEGDKIELFEGV